MSDIKSDLAIAKSARLLPIDEVAKRACLKEEALYRYGPFKAKITLDYLDAIKTGSDGKLILVTAISPTPAGEGKTTTTIGLGDALTSLGKKAIICLREPSLGPCFGMKGGATGGGYAQVAPMDEINLHFTGDFHAITSANNLLAAMIDNHIYWGNKLDIDPSSISFRRALDMNDRALREVRLKLNNKGAVRDEGFDITVASEVMAVFCLAQSMKELEEGLGQILVARTTKGAPLFARDLMAHRAMTALLRDAFQPNLAQTLEHTPAFIHGGPFANIAHGCNSLMATKSALKLADYIVTEAGFGADLGAEKFFDIKCRKGDLRPSAAVIVASLRALKMHGGVAKADLSQENVEAVQRGLTNLNRHIENVQKFGVPVVVAVNHFVSDTAREVDAVLSNCAKQKVTAHLCRHWAEGGKGAEDLAKDVISMVERESQFKPLYADSLSLADKITVIATEIYRAKDVTFSDEARADLQKFEADGYGRLPVCMAKTQYSFSSDPALLGAPTDFTLHVRDVRLMAGAGFVTALCGSIMTMPGLPRRPAAEDIYVGNDNEMEGLF